MTEERCHYACCESEKITNLKCCSGCRNVWYCSKACQKDDWNYHIFACKVGQPISTVYHLARAIFGDVVPVDPQTRCDYGFDKAEKILGGESGSKLCGLYRGLLIILEVPLKKVRTWQREGRLLDGIKAAFETLPPNNRGGYFPWLLQHPYILDGTPVDAEFVRRREEQEYVNMVEEAWVFTGGSPDDTPDMIKSKIAAMTPTRRDCYHLYSTTFHHLHPSPNLKIWLTSGFVAAMSLGEEQEFGRNYHKLVRSCSFDEFCKAYESSTIPELFDRHGISFSNTRLFRDVMSGTPHVNKSVWNLKHYIDELICTDMGKGPTPIPSVSCDYGYFNCKVPAECKLLDDLYKYLFTELQVDPLALHEACLKGELLEFAKNSGMKLSPHTTKYTRLLKNPYPLPDFDSGLRIVPITAM